jgi:hypothetical protein
MLDHKLDNMEQPTYFGFEQIEQGIERYVIDIETLYPDVKDREAFESRWESFYLSDITNPDVFFREGSKLVYYSESIVPTIESSRPRMLLVFGNPAPHSIKERTIFSYEGDGREHRVWKIFRNVGLIDFPESEGLTNSEKNVIRKKQLWNAEYESPFILGFVPYFSMPSTPSTEPWTGVSGVRRLFGSNVMKMIEIAEKVRMDKFIRQFMINQEGVIIAFQKDAYNGLRDQSTPEYTRDEAVAGNLISQYPHMQSISVLASGPTRSLHSMKSRDFLKNTILRFK